jgi:hypothetical protein
MTRGYTVSKAFLKSRAASAVQKYGAHTKIEGMARCGGPCRELLPFESFPQVSKRFRGSWCAACRLKWSQGGESSIVRLTLSETA